MIGQKNCLLLYKIVHGCISEEFLLNVMIAVCRKLISVMSEIFLIKPFYGHFLPALPDQSANATK